ncbi:MAG: cysteine synthase A [Deltaproteobacteria bacterium]|nr:cysteine synthase A [Deltaproteobacteria bacterium]
MKIAENITQLIGNTPLVKLNTLTRGINATVLVKMESQNPGFSVKDRLALSMITDAESKGLLSENSTIIEPTSGNTGIALAFIAAQRGYKIILTMPESMSIERRKILMHLGALLELTPAKEGMKGSIKKAEELKETIDGGIILQQFENPANPKIHRETTALEIWNDTDGKVDIFVTGAGTGGTITGVSQVLKEKNPSIKTYAVEPLQSPVISGGAPGPHKIQGIGAGFIPGVFDTTVIDGAIKIDQDLAFETSRALASKEGILAGISSGANVAAAIELARKTENTNKIIVTTICDLAERYLSIW